MTEIEDIVGFSRDDEIMGRYVREIHEHLTVDDVKDAIRRARLFSDKKSDRLFAAHRAADEVAGLAGYSHGSLAHWAALGVESLTGTIVSLAEFKTPRWPNKPDTPYETLEQLRVHVEEEIKDAEAVGSPWADRDKAIVREWLSQTPYQIWLLVHELEEKAAEFLQEVLFDVTRQQEDGRSLARNIQDEWERRLISNWERNWKSRWDGSVPAPLA
jgi:hypothetical protein